MSSLKSESDWARRSSILAWLNFSESLMTHSLPIIYSRWFARADVPGDAEFQQRSEEMLKVNVGKDLDAIEKQLKENQQGEAGELYLVGNELSIADISECLKLQRR